MKTLLDVFLPCEARQGKFSGEATLKAQHLSLVPRQTTSTTYIAIINDQFIFIKTIKKIIMAGGAEKKEDSSGATTPRQKGRATVDTLR